MKLHKIVVPLDFSANSRKALRYAVEFAKKLGGIIHLVYVTEPASFMNDLSNVPIVIEEADITARAADKLNVIAEEEITGRVEFTTEVRTGKPFDEIIKAAKENDADLIIISTHGYTGLKHVFMGSTAERIVRHATCPVLVVRQKETDFA